MFRFRLFLSSPWPAGSGADDLRDGSRVRGGPQRRPLGRRHRRRGPQDQGAQVQDHSSPQEHQVRVGSRLAHPCADL